jgi:ATP-dependent Clp protease ATP-binding subunit ClpB
MMPLPTTERDLTSNVDYTLELDSTRNCPEAIRLEMEMKRRVVGQDQAIAQVVAHYQTWLAGLASSGRPICNLLLLGPTGCGKTRIVEAIAEAVAGDAQAVVKVDCGEFQHSHEIAKLIGSPPGYLGHRETHPRLCQEKLDLYHTDTMKLSFVLFDEIEKASDALWNLLLGILDKGTLTLGDNRTVDFSNTMVFLTGNLGTAEAQRLRELPWGFSAGPGAGCEALSAATRNPESTGDCGAQQPEVATRSSRGAQVILPMEGPTTLSTRPHSSSTQLDQRMERSVMQAARRKFSPEFLNRLDRVIFCRALDQEQVGAVLDLELKQLLSRIRRQRNCSLDVSMSEQARDYLIEQGFDPDCGARYLKRAIDKHLVQALSSLLATHQLCDGDELLVDYLAEQQRLSFRRGARRSSRLALREIATRWNQTAVHATAP